MKGSYVDVNLTEPDAKVLGYVHIYDHVGIGISDRVWTRNTERFPERFPPGTIQFYPWGRVRNVQIMVFEGVVK